MHERLHETLQPLKKKRKKYYKAENNCMTMLENWFTPRTLSLERHKLVLEKNKNKNYKKNSRKHASRLVIRQKSKSVFLTFYEKVKIKIN